MRRTHTTLTLVKLSRPTTPNPPAQPSVYDTYIHSLAPSGRPGITSLLHRCAAILAPPSSAQSYRWEQLSFAHVARLRAELLDAGYAVSSVNMALAALRGLSQTAFNLRLMDAEELARIKAVKRVKGETCRKGRALSRDEMKALLNAAKQHPQKARCSRDRALLLVACGAGLRAAELVALTLDDYIQDEGQLIVRQGKGRKYRSIHVAKTVASAVNAWLKHRGPAEGALFSKISRAGAVSTGPLTKAGFASILDNLRNESGVATFSPHDLRRTFITRLLEQGVDINTVRQLAGHSDIATTQRYDCRGTATRRSASRAFAFW